MTDSLVVLVAPRRGLRRALPTGPWCLLAVFLLALATPLQAAQVDRLGPLPSLLERFPAEEEERRTSSWYEPLAAVEALYSLFQSSTPPPGPREAALGLAGAFGVRPAAGRALLEATLCFSALSEDGRDLDLDDQADVDASLRPCNERILAALRQTPELPAVRELVQSSHETFAWRIAGAPERLAAEVGALPDPVPVALDLAHRLGAVYHTRLTQVALERAGPHPAVLFEAVGYTDDPVFRAAAYEAAWRELRARSSGGLQPAPPEVDRLVARQWLWTLLKAGLADEARRALDAFPDDVRRTLAEVPPDSGKDDFRATLDELPLRAPAVDLRIPLTALYATGNDPGEAGLCGEILSSFPEWARPGGGQHGARIAPGGSADAADGRGEALAWRVLDRLMAPGADDPFGLLTEIAAMLEQRPEATDPLATGIVLLATAELASREAYPEIAAYLLELKHDSLALGPLQKWGGRGEEPPEDETTEFREYHGLPVFPPEVEARVVELTAALESVAERVTELLAVIDGERKTSADPTPRAGDDASVSTWIQRLLATEQYDPFVEKPLPPGIEPTGTRAGAKQSGTPAAVPEDLELPEGFRAVRAEVRGQEAIAVGISQDYDPVGEVAAGAYWVVRSPDAGATWSQPLYTGLRVKLPYVVRPVSDLPLLDGELVRIEVEVREIDQDRIVLPPVAVNYERQQAGLYVEASWADLERDSDGDGLTDLVEERLVTDPQRVDTDSDGLTDNIDPMPQVPAGAPDSPAATARSGALLVALSRIAGDRAWAILPRHGPQGEPHLGDLGDRPVLTSEQTLFLSADRNQLRGVRPVHRVVVLTADELARYREKFSLTFASRIRLMSFDRESRREFVIWTASWAGGTFRLERRDDGSWELIPISSWIT